MRTESGLNLSQCKCITAVGDVDFAGCQRQSLQRLRHVVFATLRRVLGLGFRVYRVEDEGAESKSENSIQSIRTCNPSIRRFLQFQEKQENREEQGRQNRCLR